MIRNENFENEMIFNPKIFYLFILFLVFIEKTVFKFCPFVHNYE